MVAKVTIGILIVWALECVTKERDVIDCDDGSFDGQKINRDIYKHRW